MFSGCGKTEYSNAVLTSFYPIYLITNQITKGTDIKIENMARPQTGCLHDYQLTTRDMRLIDKASVFIINGAGMENSFMNQAILNSGVAVIDSSNGIELEKAQGDDSEVNSHIWMSPEKAGIQAKNICDGLCCIFPQYSDTLKKNTSDFVLQTKNLVPEKASKKVPVLSFNEAFGYLLEENNCYVTASVEIDENTVPSAKELAEITDKARKTGVKAIFTADDAGVPFAQTLSRELDVPVYVLDPLTYGSSSNEGYLQAMEKNISIIKEAIK
jgi:zinc transport system substrate-binding protein